MEQHEALDAFVAGFGVSLEGWNGEVPGGFWDDENQEALLEKFHEWWEQREPTEQKA